MNLLSAVAATLLLCSFSSASDYRVDRQMGKDRIGTINQLAVGLDQSVYALEANGKITVFKGDGTIAATINTGMQNTTALAVADDGTIHVFSTLTETKKVKVGARMRKVEVPDGVEQGIFDPTGKKLKTNRLDQLTSASAARIIGRKLVVADLSKKSLVFLDLESGKETARLKKGLRLCCGIFDFCEGPEQTVAVSNLGAFKLQRYNLDGNLVMEFGKRGRDLDDFQGCCNPVSAAYLPGGAILTVEKDPTRIKVYDADGKNARQIPGVEELVKGCSYIPSTVDRDGNIYLAANTKGYIIKCVK